MSGLLHLFSGVMTVLNRGLAWVDFAVHYTSGYFFYYCLGGMKPQTHTKPWVRNGRVYSPSVIVTGASQGIGFATAVALAKKGYNVFATVKDEDEAQRAVESASSAFADKQPQHGAFHVTIMNVLSNDSIQHCVEEIKTALQGDADKPLVGLVNNAGFCMIAPMELTSDEDIRRAWDLDFFAYIAVIRAFLPIMKESKGRFINIGSFGGYSNVPMWVNYCAIKAAIENMTRAWRFELMPFGVGMTTVRPGFTRTTGIGPKISNSWEMYYDDMSKGAIGVDSLGNALMASKPTGEAEEKIYRPIMDKWHTFCVAGVKGAAQPNEAVAETVHDALSDRFLQPYYTVGYDALLGQMGRDLLPESVWDYSVAKSFGCL